MTLSLGGPMPLSNHRLQKSHLDLLYRGQGSAELTHELRITEFSRRLLIVKSVTDLLTGRPEFLGNLPPAAHALDLLQKVDDDDRDIIRDVLLHPQVGAWAAYLMRRSLGFVESDAPLWVDAGVLHAVAFVAAVRHGHDWTTLIPARDGQAMLPGLGAAVFPAHTRWTVVEAETHAGEVTLRCGGTVIRRPVDGEAPADDTGWRELRQLSLGTDPALNVTLDDLDPFRDLGDPAEPRRLPRAEADRWTALTAGAWEILCTTHRTSAQAMASAILSIVPLADDGGNVTRSASTGEAFGSVLVSEPYDARSLAVALVHEHAHIQLGALLHLLPVTTGGDDEIFYAPWRDDPRGFPGFVQGIYAFVNIAGFWRDEARAHHDVVAEFEYLHARRQAELAISVAAASGRLTEVGTQLIARLADRVAGWSGDITTGAPFHAAGVVTDRHRAGWRIRHLTPAPESIGPLATAWSRGDPAPLLDPGYHVVAGDKRWSQGQLALARRWATRGDATPTPRLRALGVDDADAALLAGEKPTATARYARRIIDDSGDLDAWSGLSVALDGPAGRTLAEHPSLVRAIHAGTDDFVKDPVALAAWLSQTWHDR
ncbi:HEXXH motif domain-containing protein [Winogradskya consettensis]|uniref:HEXXH motif domain-containing protein n=1 Tax=Winogradskya consettensis TaxID=113560 RepID=A0A919SRK5_9ACTN|nr:HEXXH motif domain-containing protein [Actinoplanes consettensis]GIM76634.1 HEXXH motif domain-containing protein [Actinoplanes consettensis]